MCVVCSSLLPRSSTRTNTTGRGASKASTRCRVTGSSLRRQLAIASSSFSAAKSASFAERPRRCSRNAASCTSFSTAEKYPPHRSASRSHSASKPSAPSHGRA